VQGESKLFLTLTPKRNEYKLLDMLKYPLNSIFTHYYSKVLIDLSIR